MKPRQCQPDVVSKYDYVSTSEIKNHQNNEKLTKHKMTVRFLSNKQEMEIEKNCPLLCCNRNVLKILHLEKKSLKQQHSMIFFWLKNISWINLSYPYLFDFINTLSEFRHKIINIVHQTQR